MRIFSNSFGFTSGVVNTLTISSTVPEIKFQDTTASEVDWDLYVDGDKFIFEQDSIAKITLTTYSLRVTHAYPGASNGISIYNTSTASDSAAVLAISTSTAQGYSHPSIFLGRDGASGTSYGMMFVDGSDSDNLKIARSSSFVLVTSQTAISIDTSRNVYIPSGSFLAQGPKAGDSKNITLHNTSTASDSAAVLNVVSSTAQGNSDPGIFLYREGATGTDYGMIFIDGGDSENFKLCRGSSFGTFATTQTAISIDTSRNVYIPSGYLTVKSGGSTEIHKVGGLVESVLKDYTTTTSGSEALATYSIPASLFNANGDVLKAKISMNMSTSSSNRRWDMYLRSAAVTATFAIVPDYSSTSDGGVMEIDIFRATASGAYVNTSYQVSGYRTATVLNGNVTFSEAITLSLNATGYTTGSQNVQVVSLDYKPI